MPTRRLIEYTYVGLGTAVESVAPQLGLTWSLVGGSDPANPYTGLDCFGRVVDCKWTAGGTVEELAYTYDRASNRTSRHNTVHTGNDELYAYDGVQRLVDMSRGDVAAGVISSPSFAQSWQLDATGNWSGFRQVDTGSVSGNLDQQRVSNPANEITGITRRYGPDWVTPAYDRAGNMTSVPSGLDPTQPLLATYDGWNRLVKLADGSGTLATYGYDALNRRITSTVDGTTRHVYYSAQWRALEERLDDSDDPEGQFVWGERYIDDLVLRDRFDGDTPGRLPRFRTPPARSDTKHPSNAFS